MNPPDPYTDWLERKRRVGAPPELADRIMTRVVAESAAPAEPGPWGRLLQGWVRSTARHGWIQAAVLVGGAMLGALRLLVTLEFMLAY